MASTATPQDIQRLTALYAQEPEVAGESAKESAPPAPFPKLDYSYFSDEQKKYLTLLSKYSGRRVKMPSGGGSDQFNLPVRKEDFVSQYLTYLSVDEQMDYNDQKLAIEKAYQYSYYIGILGGATAFTYFMVTVPTTRALLKEFFKSVGIGTACGYAYYKYQQVYYRQRIDSYFIVVLNRLQRKRSVRKEV